MNINDLFIFQKVIKDPLSSHDLSFPILLIHVPHFTIIFIQNVIKARDSEEKISSTAFSPHVNPHQKGFACDT